MYSVKFFDGSKFVGGGPDDSKWLKIPDKEILNINYTFGGRKLFVANYEEYNHQVEITMTFMGKLRGKRISKIAILGRQGPNVDVFTFDLMKGTLKLETREFGKEWNGGRTTGWKKGLLCAEAPTHKVF